MHECVPVRSSVRASHRYAFARKKTKSSMAVSFTQLEGAGIMNNTFCASIFLVLIFSRGLAWSFTAETVAIVLIEVLVMLMALKRTVTVLDSVVILCFYPLSLAVVVVMEQVLGFD